MYAAEDQEVPYFQASSLLKLTLLAENPKMIFRLRRFDISLWRDFCHPRKDPKRPFQTKMRLATDDVS